MFTDTLTLGNIQLLTQENEQETLEELIQQYLYYAQNVRELAPTTLKGKRIYLAQFCQYLKRNHMVELDQLTNRDVDPYFIDMKNRLSTHSANSSKRAVKGLLRWYETYKQPTGVRLSEIREKTPDAKMPDILTHREILIVIKKTKCRQDKLMISVMYETGMRISEVMDMKLEHLRGATLDVIGKGRKHRITFLSPRLAREVKQWCRDNEWSCGYVFRPIMHGVEQLGYTNSETLRKRIKREFKLIVNRDMHPHQIRHAFALRLLKRGSDLRSIQKLLGHSKIETTMIYLDIDNAYLEKQHKKSFHLSVYR